MTNGAGERGVVVVGAGLSGLACAADLAAAGERVTVLEASDAPGGRVRTDRSGGFLLDRGFQVFNTSYPQVQRRLRLRDLELCPFTPGVLLHTGSGRVRFTDPTRRPGGQADLLAGRLASPADLAALALLSARDMLLPASWLRHGREQTTVAALAGAGISGTLIELLFRPFLSGVFLDDSLETSSRFFHLIWRSMLRGTQCLPRRGMQAIPDQLATGLPAGTIRYEAPVTALTDDGVAMADGSEVQADAVVVATGPAAAVRLLPGLEVPATRAVTTWYHAAAEAPLAEPALLVDTSGAVLHTSVLTEVASSYGPGDRALISTSVLGADATEAAGQRVRARLAELYGTDTSGWELLAAYPVSGALSAMPAPHLLMHRSEVRPGRYVCGDYRASASVQGALASGARAAREVLTRSG